MNRTLIPTTERNLVTQKEGNYRSTVYFSILGLVLSIHFSGCSGSSSRKRVRPVKQRIIEYVIPDESKLSPVPLPIPTKREVVTSRVIDPDTGETLETIKICHFLPGKVPCLAGTF